MSQVVVHTLLRLATITATPKIILKLKLDVWNEDQVDASIKESLSFNNFYPRESAVPLEAITRRVCRVHSRRRQCSSRHNYLIFYHHC